MEYRLRGELDENDGGDDVVRIGGGKRALNAEEGGTVEACY